MRQRASGSGLWACGCVFVASTSVAAMVLVSVEEEIEIGRTANEQVRKQVPELKDSTVTRYVRDVGKRLVRSAQGAKYPYTFAVADLPEINAFSLPGGPVWINRGVLSKAATSRKSRPFWRTKSRISPGAMARTGSRRAWSRGGALVCWGRYSATPAVRERRRPRPVC